MTTLTDANTNPTTYAYNGDSRVTSMTYPPVENEWGETYTYNSSNLLETKSTLMSEIGYTYDVAGEAFRSPDGLRLPTTGTVPER